MKYVHMLPRLILGLIYAVFGGWGLLMAFGILPMPPQGEMPPAALAFSTGLFGSGYFMQLLKICEVTGGLLLLSGRAVPFALVLLAPITVNIFCFHFFLTPGMGQKVLPLVMVALHAYLGFVQYWKSFKPLFK